MYRGGHPSPILGLESHLPRVDVDVQCPKAVEENSCIKYVGLFRIGVLILLGSIIAIIGAVSYFILKSNETDKFIAMFESSTDRISEIVSSNFRAKMLAGSTVSDIFSSAMQNQEVGTAPNITLPGFETIMQSLIELAELRYLFFAPLLSKSTRSGWEAYAKINFDNQFAKNTIPWNVDKGIYAINSSGDSVRDTGVNANSKFPGILAPAWQVAPIKDNEALVMYDAHSEVVGAEGIDRVISRGTPQVTDIVRQLVMDRVDRPATILYTPVTAGSNETVVGFIGTALTWDDTLKNALPSYISGINCVISTPNQAYTYLLKNGEVTLIGEGRIYDKKMHPFQKTMATRLSNLTNSLGVQYQITFYPTQELYDEYNTNTPGLVCGAFVGIIVFTAIVILFYDYTLRRREQKILEEYHDKNMKAKLAEMALSELDTKSSFIRYVSHEIRNPLNIVSLGLLYLQSQLKGDTIRTSDIKEVITELEQATTLAIDIMDNLLTFEKLTSGVLELQGTRFPVMDYLEECLQSLSLQLRQSGVNVDYLVDPQLRGEAKYYLEADKMKMSQVIRTILSNAIKFTPRGGTVTVKVSLVARQANEIHSQLQVDTLEKLQGFVINKDLRHAPLVNKVLKFEVTDQGPGISLENQKRLFKDIVQFIPGELQDGKGSGLSLWVSHQIITLHSGQLYMCSDGLGHGCTFTFEIPILDQVHINGESGLHVFKPFSKRHSKGSQSQTSSNKMSRESLMETATKTLYRLTGRDIHQVKNERDGREIRMTPVIEEGPTGPPVCSANSSIALSFPTQSLHQTTIATDTAITGTCITDKTWDPQRRSSEKCESRSFAWDSVSNDDHIPRIPSTNDIFSRNLDIQLKNMSVESLNELPSVHKPSEFPVESGSNRASTSASMFRFPNMRRKVHVETVDTNSGSNWMSFAKVLVVDDVAMNRRMIIRVVRDRWRNIQEADNGETAVNMVREAVVIGQPYDIILMDFQMPVLNGPEAARVMREEGFKGLIVGVTGNGLPTDIDYFISCGADQVLLKPLHMPLLDKCIEGILKSLT